MLLSDRLRDTLQIEEKIKGRLAVERSQWEREHHKLRQDRAALASEKESLECSGRGICDGELGTCICDLSCAEGCFSTSDGHGNPGGRGDCGYRDGTVTGETIMPACPGEVPCNDRGICDEETWDCTCIDGFTGADCTLMTCPKGRSWFSAPVHEIDDIHLQMTECSDMGYCNRDYGECECAPGFEGAACQYMKCPGADVEGPCFNQGECLSLSFLAEASLDNGVSTKRTYGKTPNDKYRWDYDSIRGCKCNRDRMGWDCSQKLCPFGDDPLSTSQYNELQNLNCDLDDDTQASVRFTFREEVTDALDPTTATAAAPATLTARWPTSTRSSATSSAGAREKRRRWRPRCRTARSNVWATRCAGTPTS